MEQITAFRAEWLAQLSEAIEGAQRLAWQLRTQEQASVEARELYGRLEAARVELESLRRTSTARCADERSCGDWLDRLGWTGSLTDPGS